MLNDAILMKMMPHAEKVGFTNISRTTVSQVCKCSPATISYRFGDMLGFRVELLQRAIETENYAIIIQALSAKGGFSKLVPKPLMNKALQSAIN